MALKVSWQGAAEEVAAPVMVENFLRESLVDGLVRSVIE